MSSYVSNPFYSKISKSIEDYVIKLGHSLIVCSTEANPEKERALIDILANGQNVTGVIV